MHIDEHVEILKTLFLRHAKVKDAKTGYLVAKPFNLCIDSDILQIASHSWAEKYRTQTIDAIVGLPDAGARLVSLLANMLDIPEILPAKRAITVPSAWEDVVSFENDSFTSQLKNVQSHIGYVTSGQRILVIDDVCAHGETAIAAIKALQEKGAIIIGFSVLFDKVWQGGLQRVEDETGVPAHSLIRVNEINPSGAITLL